MFMCRRDYNGISQSDLVQILWKFGNLLHFILSWHPPERIEIHSASASKPRCPVTFCSCEYNRPALLTESLWMSVATVLCTAVCTPMSRECVCMCCTVTSTNWEVTGRWPYCAITWPVKPTCQASRPSSPSTITALCLDSLCHYAFIHLVASTVLVLCGPSLRNIKDALQAQDSKLHFCRAFCHSVHHNVLSIILQIFG